MPYPVSRILGIFLHLLVACVFIDYVMSIWDLEFNAGLKVLSREEYYVGIPSAGLPSMCKKRVTVWKPNDFIFARDGNRTKSGRSSWPITLPISPHPLPSEKNGKVGRYDTANRDGGGAAASDEARQKQSSEIWPGKDGGDRQNHRLSTRIWTTSEGVQQFLDDSIQIKQ